MTSQISIYFTLSDALFFQGARLRAKSEKLASGEDADDDSDEEDIEEELGYISPLDDVNPYTAFKQSLTGKLLACPRLGRFSSYSNIFSLPVFQMRNPAGYQAATTALNVDEQTLLMEIMRIADQPTPLAAI